MRLLILTSNAIRHKFVANTLTQHAGEALVISECRPSDVAGPKSAAPLPAALAEHFRLRHETEQAMFAGHNAFFARTLPLLYGEASLPATGRVVQAFRPELAVVFGASLIREPLLSLLPDGRTVNLHLGLSPYYRGSGTNFWPFVNAELEYVGATLLHLDAGVDTGPIVAHVTPEIEPGDTAHTVGCKVIAKGAEALLHVMRLVQAGQALARVPQWTAPNGRYYRNQDVTEETLRTYHRNLDGGLIRKHLSSSKRSPKLIPLAPSARLAVTAAGGGE